MLRRIRIPVQLAFLALFLLLLALTVGTGQDRLGPPVKVFLDIDPLAGISTWLRTGAWPGLLWLSLITLGLTFVLGRFFCGWVCPLGTLGQLSGRLWRRRRDERSPDRWRSGQRWKTWVLLFLLGSAIGGAQWSGLLDPLSLLIRGLALGFGPAADAGVRAAGNALYSTPLSSLSEPGYRAVRDHMLAPHAPRFEQGWILAGVLLAVLALSWVIRRFWCRFLCPLGALLGLTARAGVLRLRQSESSCSGCGVCAWHCQGAAEPERMGGWRPDECYVCGNCTASCRQGGIAFTFGPPRIWAGLRAAAGRLRGRGRPGRPAPEPAASVERRRLLLALGLGLASGSVAGLSASNKFPASRTIRPPGAGPETDFLDRCIRCGECMKVCVGNGLHPAGLDTGISSLWTPILRPRLGYCEYQCTLCGQVCPTGAIERLSPEAKKATIIGLAFVDLNRCLPYAYATPCIVCEEHCPTSPKAILLESVEAVAPDGSVRRVRRPRVDAPRCVGCGICEFRCPVEGDAAIRIASAGRSGQESLFLPLS